MWAIGSDRNKITSSTTIANLTTSLLIWITGARFWSPPAVWRASCRAAESEPGQTAERAPSFLYELDEPEAGERGGVGALSGSQRAELGPPLQLMSRPVEVPNPRRQEV